MKHLGWTFSSVTCPCGRRSLVLDFPFRCPDCGTLYATQEELEQAEPVHAVGKVESC
jgi:hypothetical protein